MRQCTKCKLSKDESMFYSRDKSRGTYHSACKTCADSNRYNWNTCACGSRKRIVSELCQKCRNDQKAGDSEYLTATLGDKTYIKHKYAKYAYVRHYARKIGKSLGFDSCRNCGYNKHFEVCHIKSVASFPSDTLLTVINDPNNLIPLCPNCHYEFDNGFLIIVPPAGFETATDSLKERCS